MKKWCYLTGLISIICLGLMATLVLVIDPFFAYHKPITGIAYKFLNEAYQVPGIAKNFEYDNIVVGSSMTENFSTDLINEEFDSDNTVKLCYSGCSLKNQKEILEIALKREDNNAKRVFMSLDLWNFQNDYNIVSNASPEFLLNNNIFDDAKYLLNKDVLSKYIFPILKDTAKGNNMQSMDSAFRWYGFPYGDYAIFNQWELPQANFQEQIPEESFLQMTKDNVDYNIKPLIESFPNVEFYMFFPPYSILYWYEQSQSIDAVMAIREYVFKELSSYTNVHIYDFQAEGNLILNLWNYKDTKHYGPEINDFITKCFANGTYMLKNHEELRNNNFNIKNMAMQEDIADRSSNALWKIDNIYDYLDAINSQDYIVYMSVKQDSSWGWTEQLDDYWKKIGFKEQLAELHGSSYIAMISSGNILYEKASDTMLEYQDLRTTVISGGENSGNPKSRIKIDGVEYSQNSRGMNIVVFDKNLSMVIDSVCFDTCSGLGAQRMNRWQ